MLVGGFLGDMWGGVLEGARRVDFGKIVGRLRGLSVVDYSGFQRKIGDYVI